MKRSYFILATICLISLSFACTSEIQEEESRIEVVSVHTESGASKVTVNSDGVPAWAAGDEIAVYQGNGFNRYSLNQVGDDWNVAIDVSTNERSFVSVYPYNENHYCPTNHNYVRIFMPSSYDYDSVSGTNAPCPMLSSNNPGEDMVFYALGSLLRLTLNNVPVEATSIEIGLGQRISGNFKATDLTPGSAYIRSTEVSSEVVSVINISSSDYAEVSEGLGKLIINLPVPVAGYSSITVNANNSSGDLVATKTSSIQNTSYLNTRAGGLKKTMNLTVVENWSSKITPGSGFRISTGTLHIAPGNLQLSAGGTTSGTWSFLSGTDQLKTLLNLHTTPVVASGDTTTLARDVFTALEIGKWLDGQSFTWESNIDGSRKVGNDGYDWRLPTKDELSALINASSRTGSKATIGNTTGAVHAKIRVDVSESSEYSSFALSDSRYIYGMMLFPDGYNDQTGLITTGINQTGAYSPAWTATSIVPFDAFEAMVNAGAVFMPATGKYSSNSNNGNWRNVSTYAYSLSSNYGGSLGYYHFYITNDQFKVSRGDISSSNIFIPVRLVRLVND